MSSGLSCLVTISFRQLITLKILLLFFDHSNSILYIFKKIWTIFDIFKNEKLLISFHKLLISNLIVFTYH